MFNRTLIFQQGLFVTVKHELTKYFRQSAKKVIQKAQHYSYATVYAWYSEVANAWYRMKCG